MPRADDGRRNAHGQILLRGPENVNTGAKARQPHLGRGLHRPEAWHDNLVIHIRRVITAVLGDAE